MNKIILFDIEPIKDALTNKELIITANQRLCNKIKSAWAEYQHQSGLSAWETPHVFAFNSWLNDCWFILQSQCYGVSHNLTLLSDDKELWLWKNIISQTEIGKSLLLINAAAESAKQAHQVLSNWKIQKHDPRLKGTMQAEAFLDWLYSFAKTCQEQGVMSPALLPDLIINAYQDKALTPVEKLHLVGFDELSPAQNCLFDLATKALNQYESQDQAASIHQIAMPDQETEIFMAAQWAKTILEDTPGATLGILCPNLPDNRKKIERILNTVFEPQAVLPSENRYASPYNFSAGSSLAEQAIIHQALEILSLNLPQIPFETLVTLLHSPFIVAGETESEGRILAELFLRRNALPEISLAQFKKACEKQDHSPQLHQALINFSELFRAQTRRNKKCLPEEWATLFLNQLEVMGWPGERRLDSIEYQQVSQWESVLNNFASYNDLTGPVDSATALHLLKTLSQKNVFQAKTPDSPIQVLGLLEGASLHFSHLWVMGLDDNNWPAAARPNPFLPARLQKDCAMPHASAERELNFAKSLMEKITHSSREIIFSYCSSRGESALKPSGLIEDYPEISIQGFEEKLGINSSEHCLKTSFLADKQKSADTIIKAELAEQGPAISTEEMPYVRGGTSIFKNQALCPFKSFATHRLKAQALYEPAHYLDAMDRGTLLHSALEYLWQQLKSQQTLLNSKPEQLQDLISSASSHSLETFCQQRPKLIGPKFKFLEIKRLNNLLNMWLDIEREREPFEVIGFEQVVKIEYEGIPLRLQLDRVDRTEDGAYHLIDYKTGAINTNHWLPDSFTEPQLPLYAVIESRNQKPVNGIHYGKVNISECSLKGLPESLVAEKKSSNKNSSDQLEFQDLLKSWETQLSQLAKDFINGEALIAPREDRKPCQYCELSSLCRINELNMIPIDEDSVNADYPQESGQERGEV